MDYIKRIRELREDNDYTQREVAVLLNVGQRTYADYEYGKTRIPLESMIKLAKFYKVDMNYICGVSDVRVPFPNNKGK
ncbi:helix-turn-helix domain-containing protein [Enterococcus termitis]|uniref:Transcriptional regulator n=1 Tax=Enterococcus termitis TaxID=332950 RepID=A0A1E5GY63_9ENTE|nr:helix-turn-helix transcriptional regulator [Enterococcus termitis]OEG17613.1 transcriptional regulator [Enterococcus termitis]